LKRARAIEFLDQLLERRGLDALLITDLADVWYLSGFRGSEGTILYSRQGACFFSDFRYREQAKEEIAGFKVSIFKNKFKEIAEQVDKLRARSIGFEASGLSYQLYLTWRKTLKGKRLVPLKESLLSIRAVKDKDEIEDIKRAARIAEDGLAKALRSFRAGISELDLAGELECQLRKAGSGWFSFETIVASGWRAALPHAKATSKKIKNGELVVIDFGTTFNGYSSDLTVTVAAGEPGKKARSIYQIVSEAQERAIAGVKEGILCKEIDALARDYISGKGWGRYFGHGLGHGLGLAVHEEPVLNHKSETALMPGMVFTVEPGIYLPGELGVRIEDDVLLNRGQKVLLLSHSNQPLQIFE
jgi:Xaa-Pro aminopeptidase